MNEADSTSSISDLILRLYEHIHIGERPANFVWASGNFFLDDEGDKSWYYETIRAIFELPGISETWSERAVKDEMHWLLRELVKLKENQHEYDPSSIEFSTLATEWLERFQTEFYEQEYYIPVSGLILENPLTIGEVTFWPLEEKLSEIEKIDKLNTFKNLTSHRNCIANAKIAAEMYKSAEILRVWIEEALNVLRYLGSVIWYNQTAKHIYLAGYEPDRISNVIQVDNLVLTGVIGDSLFSPVPYEIDGFFTATSEGFGINEISNWLQQKTISPQKKLLLNSIQWFGNATQEIHPLQAFIKYYIAIESLLKKNHQENAKNVIPKRANFITQARDKSKRENEIRSIIDERNSIFHEGRTLKDTPDVLRIYTHQLARNVINGIIQKYRFPHIYLGNKQAEWKTKEEFINWIDNNLNHV